MTEQPTRSTPVPAVRDVVDSETPCIGCGYVLRGLAMDGVCPECTVSVRRSLQGDHLMYADPGWLRVLVLGQSAFAAGIVAIVVSPILFSAFVVSALTQWDVPEFISVILWGVPLLGGLAILFGTMIGTTQDPRDSERESPTSARRVARSALLLAVLLTIIAEGLSYLRATAPYEVVITHVLIQVVLPGLFTVAVIATLRWMNLLARRMRSDDLTRLTKSAIRGLGWMVGFVIAFIQVEYLTGGAPPAWAEDGGLRTLWEIFFGVLRIAYAITFFVLLFRMIRIAVIGVRMRSDLARVATAAREIADKGGDSVAETPSG